MATSIKSYPLLRLIQSQVVITFNYLLQLTTLPNDSISRATDVTLVNKNPFRIRRGHARSGGRGQGGERWCWKNKVKINLKKEGNQFGDMCRISEPPWHSHAFFFLSSLWLIFAYSKHLLHI